MCGLLGLGNLAFAQVPTISYSPTTYSYTINTAITAFGPSASTGVTGSFAATTTLVTVANATFGVITYDAFSGDFYAVSKGNIYQITPAGAIVNTYNPGQLNNANSGTGIITDALGDIYISDNNNNTVVEFGPTGTWIRTITGFTTPNGLAVDGNNNVYVVDGSGTGTIYKIPTGTANSKTAIITNFTQTPYGLAINGNDIYVSQNGGSNNTRSIIKIANGTTGSTAKTTFVPGGSGFTGPRDMTFDAFGDLFLADGTTVKMISPTGVVSTALTGLTTPGQVDFDSSGNMYIADGGTTIKKSVVTYYAYTGTLPPGITFNATTGTFSGTPNTLGTYNVSVTAKNTSGTSTAVALTFTIKAHPPVLSFTPNAYTFVNGTTITAFSVANSGDPVVGNYSITSGTLPSGLTFTASTGTISGTPNAITAGAVTITVSGTNTGGTASATVNITVNNPPPPVITYTDNDVYINGTTISPNLIPNTSGGGPVVSYSAPTLPAGLSINTATGVISGTPTAASPSTGYVVTATNQGGTGTFTINITVNNPAVPSFTYTNPAAITYGGTVSVTPVNSGGTPTSCTISPTGTGVVVSAAGVVSGTPNAAGTTVYTITPSNAGGTGPAATVTITVNQAVLTVTVNNQTKVYGAALPALTFAYSGFVNGDTQASLTTGATVTTTATASSPVSPPTYPITASGVVDPNYTFNYVAGALTITKAALTVKANAQTKVYGTAFTFAGTEFTTTGLQPGDAVTSVTLTSPGAAATATVAGSTYTITPSAATGTGLSNYTITYTTNTFTVTKATLTVTANNQTKVYGSTFTFAGTEFTVGAGQLKNADNVTGSTITSTGSVATATVAGSPYPILISAATGTGLANYTIGYINGSMTVTPAPVTITANSQTRDVGITTTLTVTYSGLQNGATTTTTQPTIATTATATSPVGTYPITASGAADPNYTISYVAGVLTIAAPGTHTYTWDWTAASNTTWENPLNWSIDGVQQLTNYPGSATNKDIADIGVNILFNATQNPVITNATVSVTSINFGSSNSATNIGLTVNGTGILNTSSDITLQAQNQILGNNLNINLSGSGTINVPDLNVINNQAFLSGTTASINSSVANLNVSGNITLTTTAGFITAINSKFIVTGGTTTVAGYIYCRGVSAKIGSARCCQVLINC